MNKKTAIRLYAVSAAFFGIGFGIWCGGQKFWIGYELHKLIIVALLMIIGFIVATYSYKQVFTK